jgi:hypothetical protein
MAIEDFIGQQYHGVSQVACWDFARLILADMGKRVPPSLQAMTKVDKPVIGAIVLFKPIDQGKANPDWHVGVVGPTTAEFVHARPPLSQPDHPLRGVKDSLGSPYYWPLIDGYYVYDGASHA